jgi:hypothetical protein
VDDRRGRRTCTSGSAEITEHDSDALSLGQSPNHGDEAINIGIGSGCRRLRDKTKDRALFTRTTGVVVDQHLDCVYASRRVTV